MSKLLPRALLYGLASIGILLALTFIWLLGDLILVSRAQVTQAVIDRAFVFLIVASGVVLFLAARRFALSVAIDLRLQAGLLVGIVAAMIELIAQLIGGGFVTLVWISIGVKLVAAAAGGLAAKSTPEPALRHEP